METLVQMEIAKFEAAMAILSSASGDKATKAKLDEYIARIRKESELLIAKMELGD